MNISEYFFRAYMLPYDLIHYIGRFVDDFTTFCLVCRQWNAAIRENDTIIHHIRRTLSRNSILHHLPDRRLHGIQAGFAGQIFPGFYTQMRVEFHQYGRQLKVYEFLGIFSIRLPMVSCRDMRIILESGTNIEEIREKLKKKTRKWDVEPDQNHIYFSRVP